MSVDSIFSAITAIPTPVVATGAMIAAVISAGASVYTVKRSGRMSMEIEQMKLDHADASKARDHLQQVSKYSEPLARAAYDLQSRFWNILNKRFIETYMASSQPRESVYAVENTTFLIAQYMCWAELLRRDVQYANLGEDARTRGVHRTLDEIVDLWGTDTLGPMRLFAGEQRAVGETLIVAGSNPPECMGYQAYLASRAYDGSLPILQNLKQDVEALKTTPPLRRDRLKAIQHKLVELISELDREETRFDRWKMTPA